MKRIRKSRAARYLSWILTASMVSPAICGLFAQSPAGAQAATGTQTVIVVDFTNKTNDPLGAVLARQATDAVAVEMASSGKYEVLKRDEVDREARDLGLRAPYDKVAKSKLAQQLGASAIVEGAVEFIKGSKLGAPQMVSVGLSVRISDAPTGDLIAGAAQIGQATARAGQSDRASLAQESVSNASVLAVRQIQTYILPQGTVTSTVGSDHLQILVNLGSRDGVQNGMEMSVTRGTQRVGKLRITSVFPTDSEAEVMDNSLGIAPADHVRALFPMPTFNVHGDINQNTVHAVHSSPLGAIGKLLTVVAIGILIATVARGGNTAVTGVTAEAQTVNGTPAVRVIWRDNLFGGGLQTLEYHIWRTPDAAFNSSGIPVAAVSTDTKTYTDLPGAAGFWNAVRTFLQPGLNNTNNGGGGGGGGGGVGGGGNTSTTVTPALGAVPGVSPNGQTYTYQITSVIRRPVPVTTTGGNNGGGGGGGVGGGGGGVGGGGNGGGGGGNGGGGNGNGNGGGGGTTDVETSPVSSGPTTPLTQPVLISPSDLSTNVTLANVTVSWQSITGADQFVVEVSTDRSFTNKSVIRQHMQFSTAPNVSGALQTTTLNLTQDPVLLKDPTFARFVNHVAGAVRPVIYVRVGARNSGDKPGPVDWISKNHADVDTLFRFIYSLPRSFTPADVPPPPPGG